MSSETFRIEMPVQLRCTRCDTPGSYHVGMFMMGLDLTSLCEEQLTADLLEGSCGFSASVHCHRCHSAGPWIYPPETRLMLIDLVNRRARGDHSVPLIPGSPQAFDGTPFQYGGEVENYLKRLLVERPDDAVLWTRLGLFYNQQGMLRKARQAFEQALHINPSAIEALYGLGVIKELSGSADEASHCYRKILRMARFDNEVKAELRRLIVENAVEHLLKIDADSGERRLLFDLDAVLPEEDSLGDGDVYLQDFDPGQPEEWKQLIDSILGLANGPAPADSSDEPRPEVNAMRLQTRHLN